MTDAEHSEPAGPVAGDPAERRDLSLSGKVQLPESFRQEFAEVLARVRTLVDEAERAREGQPPVRELARVLEVNATLLRSLFETQKRLLESDDRLRKNESLALSTRALNETFRSVAQSQEALASRLETGERSRRGYAIGFIAVLMAACAGIGIVFGLTRERDRASAIEKDLGRLRDTVATIGQDRLTDLAERYETQAKRLEEEGVASQSQVSDLRARLDAAEARGRETEQSQMGLRDSLEHARAALVESESFARSETDRADGLVNEVELARRAIDELRSQPVNGKDAASRVASPASTVTATGVTATPPKDTSSLPVEAAKETLPEETVSKDPTLLEKVQADFNRLLTGGNGGSSFRLVSLSGVGGTSLRGVVVECLDPERRTRKLIEADRLEVFAEGDTGSVELHFRDGRLLYDGRPYPFLNGRYGVPVLGAQARDLASSALPRAPQDSRKQP